MGFLIKNVAQGTEKKPKDVEGGEKFFKRGVLETPKSTTSNEKRARPQKNVFGTVFLLKLTIGGVSARSRAKCRGGPRETLVGGTEVSKEIKSKRKGRESTHRQF